MCGICGKWNFDGQPIVEAELRRMCQGIAHRGPDEEGIFLEGGISLGNRRLSIIDLNTGDQPVSNEDQSIWIVFNVEIYNFQELRPDLQRRGHHCRSKIASGDGSHATDSRVWEPALLQNLNLLRLYS